MEEEKQEERIPRIIQVDRTTGKIVDVPEGEEYNPENESEHDGMLKTVGVVVPKGVKTNIGFLKNAREYALAPDNDIYEQIRMSNIMYYREGLVGTAIDIFVEYATTSMDVEGVGDKEKDILMWWMENVNRGNNNMTTGIQGLINEMMLEYWIAGNIFIFRVDHDVPSTELGSKNIRGKKIKLPMEVYLIDPMFIEIPEVPTIIGNKQLFMKLDNEVVTLLRSGSEDGQAILDGLPQDIRGKISSGREFKIPLPMDLVTHIKRKSRGYQTWGIPYLTKVFGDFARKKKLQALDEATVDGLINQITIFKIGDIKDETKQTWDPRRLRAFASLLAQPNHTNYLVWTPDVEVETVAPSQEILNFDKKYEQVDRQILKALGIPTTLLSGEGASSDRAEGNAYVSLSPLMEKIESAREQIRKYVEELMFKVLEANNDAGVTVDLKKRPKLRWSKPNLRNEKELRDFVLAMFDRGLLPYETTLKEANYDWNEIVRLKVKEIEEGVGGKETIELFVPPNLPFSQQKDGSPGAPGSPTGPGRPPGTTKDGPPKPQDLQTDTTFDSAFTSEQN